MESEHIKGAGNKLKSKAKQTAVTPSEAKRWKPRPRAEMRCGLFHVLIAYALSLTYEVAD